MVNLQKTFKTDEAEQSYIHQPVINNDFNKIKAPVKVFDKYSITENTEEKLISVYRNVFKKL